MNLQSRQGAADAVSPAILNALPHPVLLVDADDAIISANQAAEQFLQAGAAVLNRHKLGHFIPFGSPIFGLLEQVRARRSTVSEYRVDISSPRIVVIVVQLFEDIESVDSPTLFQALLNTGIIGALVGGVVPILFRESLRKEESETRIDEAMRDQSEQSNTSIQP